MTSDRLLRLLPFIAFVCLFLAASVFPKSWGWMPDMGETLLIARNPFLGGLSFVYAGVCIWQFERCLHSLSPGAHAFSRLLYTIVLSLSPFFMLFGMHVSSGMLALMLTLAACYQGLQALETRYSWADVRAALFGGLAIILQASLAALLGPMLLLLGWRLLRTRRWGMFGAFVATLLASGLMLWLRMQEDPSSLLSGAWSVSNFFKRAFSQVSASSNVQYEWPNMVYMLYPFMHPGFCLLLPGLWLLVKKTDFRLRSKKVLTLGLVLYLVLLGGLPEQYLPGLLPAYAVLLMLLFPAWDRFVSYGFYFFKRLTLFILCSGVLIQVIALLWLSKN
jgi:hypothetical protein